MKKIGLLVVACIIALVLFGCVSVKVDLGETPNTGKEFEPKTTEKPKSISTPVPTASVQHPQIEKTVIYESDIVTITVTGLEYSSIYKAYAVKVIIQNHSQTEISYSLNWANVNGYTIKTFTFGDVFGGMESDADFWLSCDEMSLAEIEYIQEIGFTFDISYSDSYEQICSASATIRTTDYGKSIETHAFDGTEIYSSEYYKIMAAPSSNPTIGHPVIIYIENNTEQTIMLMYDSVAINNKMVSDYMTGPFVLPNTKRIEPLELYYFGNEPDIDNINTVTVGFDIVPQHQEDYYSFYDNTITVPPVTIPIGQEG